MKAFDFFCGAGGLTRGLLDAGIKVVAGFDRDERCRDTYEYNNPGVRFVGADIREMDLSHLIKKGRLRKYDNVLFAGCAPCQPFSSQRKGNGPRHDATLLGEFGRLVEAALPGYVLIENVPGIAKVRGYSTFSRFLGMLEANGYLYAHSILDAKRYGVPQNRRRLVLFAARQLRPSLPEPKYGTPLRSFRTVRQAISHFPEISAGECHPDIPNHVVASITERNLERLHHTPHDGGDRRSWPKHLRLKCHKGNYEGHTDVYGRMHWDHPAPALTGRCHSISNGRYGHPEQDRAISLREAAAIQSFPDGYEFFGSNKHIALQIGNAVSVRLAEHLGKHILQLENNRTKSKVQSRIFS
ncbi:MAG: DNA cytosine methyltransferase [Gammaproteobacteria bacterium]|nr:DNA cytosine methyltransferase [Gammaproteobacteria bacterium]